MFIEKAYATVSDAVPAAAPDVADAFWTNMGLIAVMFVLFYVILIRPQQKRMKEQRTMLSELKKGDSVVTGGGLVGKVSKVISDDQIEVDLGATKVVSMRYSLQTRLGDDVAVELPKAEVEKAPAKKTATKTTKAKKTTTTKK
jgi:preprotein translocase subunit YajC